ncbi:MAG: tetratricopeptide repeat protein [Candidatus Binataceae bacterium]
MKKQRTRARRRTGAAAPAKSASFRPLLAKLGGGDSAAGGWMAAIIAATALIYCRSLANGFIFDQTATIVTNKYLRSWSYVWQSLVRDQWWFHDPTRVDSSYYRPLANIWIALNFHLFGLNPIGWHAGLVALHLIAVWLVFRAGALLCASRPAGLIAAALFGLMPVHVQAIEGSFGTMLCAVFGLGAFEVYLLRAALPEGDARRPRWLAVALALYAGALLSYETAVVFPALVAAHAFILRPGWQDGRDSPLAERAADALSAVWPYAIAAAAYLVVRHLVLGFIAIPYQYNRITAWQAALTAPAALAWYAALAAIPWLAGPAHSLSPVTGIASPRFYLPAIGLALAGAAALLALRRHPRRALYWYCGAWVLIALAPTLNLRGLNQQEFIHDRYLYISSFGICLIAADLIVSLARNREWMRKPAWIGAGAAMLALGYGAPLFWVQHFWHDDLTAYRRCIQEAPEAEIWHQRLAYSLTDKGDFSAARREFAIARKLNPGDGLNQYHLGRIDENLVRISGKIGAARAAEGEIAAGIRLLPRPPKDAYAQLAMAAAVAGDRPMAEAALDRADKTPDGADIAAMARAQVNFWYRDYAGVERAMREYLKRNPDDPEALVILGRALTEEHRNAEAIAVLEHAATAAPPDSSWHYVIAYGLHQLGRDAEARKEGEIALKIAPNDPRVHQLMAVLGGTTNSE